MKRLSYNDPNPYEIIPLELYQMIFRQVPTTRLITTVCLVCKEWYQVLQEDAIKARLLKNVKIQVNPKITLKEAHQQFLQTLFCIAIDFSDSMREDKENEQPDFLKMSVDKALKIAKRLIPQIPKGNLYCMQFGIDCNYGKIETYEKAKEYFAACKIKSAGSRRSALYDCIGKIYDDEIKSTKENCRKKALIKNKMEVTIISDLRVDFDKHLEAFQNKNIDLRFIAVGPSSEYKAFWDNTLESINALENNSEVKETKKDFQIFEYGKVALVLSEIGDKEVARPLARKSQVVAKESAE